MTPIRHCRNALAFLSRILPPASHDASALAAAVPYYPLAGAVLGVFATAATAFLPLSPLAAAWIYVLVLAWLTRGLHWDGAADLADACGSNTTGERFWEIMKDSRIGPFGVMAIVFGIGGQIVAVESNIVAGRWAVLVFAPAYGRAMVIIFAHLVSPHPVSTLGTLIHSGTQGKTALVAIVLVLIAALCVLGLKATGLCILLTAGCIAFLARIARRHGGGNGDFYGTVIIATETAVLLSVSMV